MAEREAKLKAEKENVVAKSISLLSKISDNNQTTNSNKNIKKLGVTLAVVVKANKKTLNKEAKKAVHATIINLVQNRKALAKQSVTELSTFATTMLTTMSTINEKAALTEVEVRRFVK